MFCQVLTKVKACESVIFNLGFIYLFFGWREPEGERECEDRAARKNAGHPIKFEVQMKNR